MWGRGSVVGPESESVSTDPGKPVNNMRFPALPKDTAVAVRAALFGGAVAILSDLFIVSVWLDEGRHSGYAAAILVHLPDLLIATLLGTAIGRYARKTWLVASLACALGFVWIPELLRCVMEGSNPFAWFGLGVFVSSQCWKVPSFLLIARFAYLTSGEYPDRRYAAGRPGALGMLGALSRLLATMIRMAFVMALSLGAGMIVAMTAAHACFFELGPDNSLLWVALSCASAIGVAALLVRSWPSYYRRDACLEEGGPVGRVEQQAATSAEPHPIATKPAHAWYRYGLWSLLTVIAVCAIARISFEEAATCQAIEKIRVERDKFAISRAVSVVDLCLGKSSADDDDLDHVRRLPHVRTLSIGGYVTDAGLAAIGGLVELQELNVVDCAVTDAGLKNLEGLKHLGKLNIESHGITPIGMRRLYKALPNCEINISPPSESLSLRHLAALRPLKMGLTALTYSSALVLALLGALSIADWGITRMPFLARALLVPLIYYVVAIGFYLFGGPNDQLPNPGTFGAWLTYRLVDSAALSNAAMWGARFAEAMLILVALDLLVQSRFGFRGLSEADTAYYPRLASLRASLSFRSPWLVLIVGFLALTGYYAMTVARVSTVGTDLRLKWLPALIFAWPWWSVGKWPPEQIFVCCSLCWGVLWLADCMARPRRGTICAAIGFILAAYFLIEPAFRGSP